MQGGWLPAAVGYACAGVFIMAALVPMSLSCTAQTAVVAGTTSKILNEAQQVLLLLLDMQIKVARLLSLSMRMRKGL